MKYSLAALCALLASSTALADTLVHNANGIQVGADGKLDRFTGLVIDDEGKVARILRAGDETPTGSFDQRVDAGGNTLLPGLIGAHGQVIGLGKAALQLDLNGTKSLAELKQRVKDYAAANPTARWILGRGWNQESWADKRFPTAADLDSVVADRPVWLGRVDGHAAIANTAAMKAAGIGPGTVAPEGGRIENGLFVDAAMTLVETAVPAPTPEELDRALAEAQRLLLSVGLTGVADMGTSPGDWLAMNRAGAAGTLKVRVLAYAGGADAMRSINGGKPSDWLYADRLHLGGVKLYADGALGSRGALLKAPYHDAPGTRGLALTSQADLFEQSREASSRGFQVAIHAIGDAANAQVIENYEKLGTTCKSDCRWRIEHVQIIDPADIGRLKPAGIIASMQPTHQTSDRLMAEARLDPPRLAGAYAWQSIARSGARIAFGSDFPVESPNPFPGLAAAVSRQDMQGQPPGGWHPEERVSFEQALAGFTRGAAHAAFAETRIGGLEPGKWADFILVDRDVSNVDPQALAGTKVLETWVAGQKYWDASARPSGQPVR
ncbi:MAG: amidohydrolase family protein [Sphingomonas sp.]|nr:amidohydrolase family protein [Sphingomonas sp.]